MVEQHAPQLVAGLYLHGSIALDAFTEGVSDIDFIAILSRQADDKDVSALELVHRSLAQAHPRPGMDGSYLRWHDLGRPAGDVCPHPCYHDGRMDRSARHGISPVDRWILKHHGVVVFGPEPESLDLEVSWEEVTAYMVVNLNTYWSAWSTSPRRLSYLLTDDGIQWAVLGVCRLLYALQMGAMISKLRAGEYALTRVPERWHALIQEAVNLRSGLGLRHYRWRLTRTLDTVAFLKYVIALCTANTACSPPTQ